MQNLTDYKRIKGGGCWCTTHILTPVRILTLQSIQHSPSPHIDPFVRVHVVALQHGFVHSCIYTQIHTCMKISVTQNFYIQTTLYISDLKSGWGKMSYQFLLHMQIFRQNTLRLLVITVFFGFFCSIAIIMQTKNNILQIQIKVSFKYW